MSDRQFHKQQRQPKDWAGSQFPAAILNPGDQRLAIALLSSIDERAEHGLDHGFDGRIIDALGLRQLGRDGFEVAIACRWRQRHRSLAHDRELAVGQPQDVIGCQWGSSRPNSSTGINMRAQLAPITFVAGLPIVRVVVNHSPGANKS